MNPPFAVQKIGHVGLYCRDLPRMVEFYTRVLGFQVSDVNEKGATFLRFGPDHHSFVLAKAPAAPSGQTVLQQIGATASAVHAQQIVVDPELVVRESTCPVAAP